MLWKKNISAALQWGGELGEILTIFVKSPPLDSKMRKNRFGYRIGYFPCVISLLSTVQSQRKTVSAQEVETS